MGRPADQEAGREDSSARVRPASRRPVNGRPAAPAASAKSARPFTSTRSRPAASVHQPARQLVERAVVQRLLAHLKRVDPGLRQLLHPGGPAPSRLAGGDRHGSRYHGDGSAGGSAFGSGSGAQELPQLVGAPHQVHQPEAADAAAGGRRRQPAQAADRQVEHQPVPARRPGQEEERHSDGRAVEDEEVLGDSLEVHRAPIIREGPAEGLPKPSAAGPPGRAVVLR